MRDLTLDELRLVADLTWPSIQSDIDANHLVELPEVEVVAAEAPLFEESSIYAYRHSAGERHKPIAPGLRTLPGRYRGWVLPLSGVCVALEPLDDELSYLRAHRRELFVVQEVDESAFIPLGELRRAQPREYGGVPANDFYALYGWLRNRRVRAYYEGPFQIMRHRNAIDDPFGRVGRVHKYLVPGTLYRIRPMKSGPGAVEVVLPEGERETVGPYR